MESGKLFYSWPKSRLCNFLNKIFSLFEFTRLRVWVIESSISSLKFPLALDLGFFAFKFFCRRLMARKKLPKVKKTKDGVGKSKRRENKAQACIWYAVLKIIFATSSILLVFSINNLEDWQAFKKEARWTRFLNHTDTYAW